MRKGNKKERELSNERLRWEIKEKERKTFGMRSRKETGKKGEDKGRDGSIISFSHTSCFSSFSGGKKIF